MTKALVLDANSQTSDNPHCCPVSLRIQYTVIEIRQTEVYARWFDGLRDRRARARIDARIRRLSLGNPGDVDQWEKASRSCASTTGPATECISCSVGSHW